MRTYDDTFSGQKIYPGKVGLCPNPPRLLAPENFRRLDTQSSSSSGGGNTYTWSRRLRERMTADL